MSTDHNLLIALLALQNNFINHFDLMAAFQSWTINKGRSIGQLLVEQQKITEGQRQLIEALAAEHLKQHGNDPQQSLATLSSVEAGRVALMGIPDEELQQTLLHVRALPAGEPAPEQRPFRSTEPNAGGGYRFRILRPHAEGGLGKVFIARDDELNREVALKEIKAKYADEPTARARFTLEAEITGGLEHPGIVPVYGLGTYADGRPYYAMRFIRGDSLKDAIAAFFDKLSPGDKSDGDRKLPATAYQSLEFRQLLRRFIDVCNAVAYAHARGVLHRDLKPGNIMLGKYGETLVVDWGLAKATGSAEAALDTSQAPLAPSTSHDSQSAETVMGSAIGTIGYMSPEQAAGRVDLFGPATDIYLLGATLYHVLTGHAPHRGKDSGLLLQRIQKHPATHPRQLNPAIPQPLAAIALKAMALQPADRFADALELSKEVERWLADEPLKSLRESPLMKFRRWFRKHPTLVTSSMLLLIVGILSAVAITFVEQAGRTKLQRQLLISQRQLFASEMRMGYSDLRARNLAGVQNVLQRAGNSRFESRLLSAMANRSQVVFEVPPNSNETVAISKKGVIAHGFGMVKNQSIKLLNMGDGREIATLQLPKDGFTARENPYFTSSGSHLIVHDVTTQSRIIRVNDGQYYPVVTRIFDGQTGQEVETNEANYPARQQISPDGKRFLYQQDNRVLAIDAATGEELYDFPAGLGRFTCAFSDDGSALAVGFTSSPTIEIRDAISGMVMQELSDPNHRLESYDRLEAIQFSGSGEDVFAICGSYVVNWHKSPDTPQAKFEHCCEFRHDYSVVGYSLDVGNGWLIIGNDGHFSVWKEEAHGKWKRSCVNLGSNQAFFCGDGRQVVSNGPAIRCWSSVANPFQIPNQGLLAAMETTDSIVYFADDLLAPKLQVFEPAIPGGETKPMRTLRQLEPTDFETGGPVFLPHRAELIFGEKGSQFIVFGFGTDTTIANKVPTSGDNGMKVFDLASGSVESSRLTHGMAEVVCLDSSRRLLAYADAKLLYLYDGKLAKSRVVHQWEGTQLWDDLCFSPRGHQLFLSRSGSHQLSIVDIESGAEEIRELAGHDSNHTVLSTSTPKNLLATSDGGRIFVRDPITFAILKTLPNLGRTISCLAFSPDGEFLAAGGVDGTVTLWDWSLEQPTLVLSEHTDVVKRIQFSLDNQVMLTSTPFESRVWDSRPFIVSTPIRQP